MVSLLIFAVLLINDLIDYAITSEKSNIDTQRFEHKDKSDMILTLLLRKANQKSKNLRGIKVLKTFQ
jgi:hypothetical protein